MSFIIFAIAMLSAPLQDMAPAPSTPEPQAQTAAPAPGPMQPVTDAEFALGEPDAPATIVVYTSMTCVACAAWHDQVLPQLIETQIATGRARLVLRQIPTRPKQISTTAAAIVRCAVPERSMNVMGAFFEGQTAMIEGGPISEWELRGVAVSGRDPADVERCVADPATLQAIQTESLGGIAAGVISVPAVFVNGQLVEGSGMQALATVLGVAPQT